MSQATADNAKREGSSGGRGSAPNQASPVDPHGANPAHVVIVCWAALALSAIFFAVPLYETARYAGDEEAAAELARQATEPLAGISRALGIAPLQDESSRRRDLFYMAAPSFGEVEAPIQVDPAEERYAPQPPETTRAESRTMLGELAALVEQLEDGGVDELAALLPNGSWEASTELPLPPGPASLPVHRVLIAGASSIQFELGQALERRLESYPRLAVERWGRHSTGLSRKDYFDWSKKAEELVEEFEPHLVIAQVGGNDCQVITEPDGDEVARFSNPEAWKSAYADRVREFIQVFTDRGARVVILGMPIMRSDSFREKMETLNDVAARATWREGEIFISTWEMTSDSDGDYMPTFELDGRDRVMRADDGIHLSIHGAYFIAREVVDLLQGSGGRAGPFDFGPRGDDE